MRRPAADVPSTGHQHHFLSRLALPHVELALHLYRDHELVRFLLGRASLPDGAERLAISLAPTHARTVAPRRRVRSALASSRSRIATRTRPVNGYGQ